MFGLASLMMFFEHYGR